MTVRAHRMAKIAMATLLCMNLTVGLCACQPDAGANSTAAQEFAIGEKSEAAFAFQMANSSGVSVTSLEVKLPGEERFSSNMMSSDKKLANGETATIYVPKNASANDETYYVDIKVVFNNGGTSVLHHLDLKDFSACTLLLQGKVGYVTYQSTVAMRVVSTLELQTYYYNLEDPDAEARDKAEAEEEKRRLEKLEEDLRSYEQQSSNASNSNEAVDANGNPLNTEEYQGADVEDDPIETNYDGDEGKD